MTVSGLVGLAGVAIYLGAYLALQLGAIAGQSYAYAGINILAAACVLVSLLEQFNLSSAMIQASWIAISVVGIARLWLGSLFIRFSDDEKALIDSVLPDAPAYLARRFLDAGAWVEAEAGREMTREGDPVASLTYIVSGSAMATLDGRTVGHCHPGDLVGEIGAMRSGPASATTRLDEPGRLFVIRTKPLQALMRANPRLRGLLEARLNAETRSKLARANAARAAEPERA